MKKVILVFLALSHFQIMQSQDKYTNDTKSLDNVIEALYEVISGDKGVKRDWDRMKNLFSADAKMMPSSKDEEGKVSARIMSPDNYVETSGSWLEENGFIEKEINRVTEEYGSLVHIWSTYESYRSSKDTAPFMRGINSIQLMHDGERWWIIQIYWLGETEDNPLPAKYLPG